MAKRRALLSVFDKTDLIKFARALIELEFELVSSGGTASELRKAGIAVTDVSAATGFPEGLGGRVKTLHPLIHAAILADVSKEEHIRFLQDHGITPFELVVCNLYPFQADPSIEMIDIGGPTMVRGAAKNHAHVGVVTDPSQYDEIIAELQTTGALSDETRQELAETEFLYTALYELEIARWISGGSVEGMIGLKVRDLNYGENPSESAQLFTFVEDRLSVTSFKLVEGVGRAPGFVNMTDIDRSLAIMRRIVAGHAHKFPKRNIPYVAIAVKHGNPCGVGIGNTALEAIQKMVVGDLQAIMGAVVMTNFEMTANRANELRKFAVEPSGDGTIRPRIFDGVCAPAFDDDATEIIKRKDGRFFLAYDPRLAELGVDAMRGGEQIRPVDGGFLMQSTPSTPISTDPFDVQMHGPELNATQWADITSGIAIAGAANSNTICLMADGKLIGLAAGQQKRNAACELALIKAQDGEHNVSGSVAVSDGFFPFAHDDGPEMLVKAGVKVIVSPGGGRVGDAEMRELCAEHGFTWLELPAEARMFSNH